MQRELNKYKQRNDKLWLSSINFPASHKYPLPIIGIVLIATGRKADRELFRVFHNTVKTNSVVARFTYGSGRITVVALEYTNAECTMVRFYFEKISGSKWIAIPFPETIVPHNIYGDPTDNTVYSIEKWQ